MGQIKGSAQWKMLQKGQELTRKEAILAMCYECNGYEDSNKDCENEGCPLYRFHPNKGLKTLKRPVSSVLNTKEKEA